MSGSGVGGGGDGEGGGISSGSHLVDARVTLVFFFRARTRWGLGGVRSGRARERDRGRRARRSAAGSSWGHADAIGIVCGRAPRGAAGRGAGARARSLFVPRGTHLVVARILALRGGRVAPRRGRRREARRARGGRWTPRRPRCGARRAPARPASSRTPSSRSCARADHHPARIGRRGRVRRSDREDANAARPPLERVAMRSRRRGRVFPRPLTDERGRTREGGDVDASVRVVMPTRVRHRDPFGEPAKAKTGLPGLSSSANWQRIGFE